MNLNRHDWTKHPELIVIFKEKHGTRYFIVRSVQDVLEVFYKIFKQRLEEGYWYQSIPEAEKDAEEFKKEIEEINHALSFLDPKTTSPVIGGQISELTKSHTSYMKSLRSIEAHIRDMQTVVNKDKADIAHYRFLLDRQNYEYEQFDFEYPEKI